MARTMTPDEMIRSALAGRSAPMTVSVLDAPLPASLSAVPEPYPASTSGGAWDDMDEWVETGAGFRAPRLMATVLTREIDTVIETGFPMDDAIATQILAMMVLPKLRRAARRAKGLVLRRGGAA